MPPSAAPSQWLEVIQHVRMTAEVEFVNHESLFPQVGLLGGNFSLIDRGDLVPLSRKLLISTVSSTHTHIHTKTQTQTHTHTSTFPHLSSSTVTKPPHSCATPRLTPLQPCTLSSSTRTWRRGRASWPKGCRQSSGRWSRARRTFPRARRGLTEARSGCLEADTMLETSRWVHGVGCRV
jgi:hypothetical protein